MLIFAPHVVQTFPEPATRSDLMYIFVKGYLGKKYGVHPVLVGKCGGKRSKHPVFVIVLAVGINTGTGKGLSIFELLQATSIITHYA